MKLYLGVDHGLSGGVAALYEDGSFHSAIPMPLKQDGTIDAFELHGHLHKNFYGHDVIACGERLHAIFRASASTTFSFGKNIGTVTAIIELVEMDYYEVRAVDWQRYMFDLHQIPEMHQTKKTPSGKLKRDTKPMALACAQRLWPRLGLMKSMDGIVDALLLAEYGRLTYGK